MFKIIKVYPNEKSTPLPESKQISTPKYPNPVSGSFHMKSVCTCTFKYYFSFTGYTPTVLQWQYAYINICVLHKVSMLTLIPTCQGLLQVSLGELQLEVCPQVRAHQTHAHTHENGAIHVSTLPTFFHRSDHLATHLNRRH